jgi:hypothetical protein
LRFHFAIRQPTAQLNDAIARIEFSVINVGNDGEVSSILQHLDFGRGVYK